MRETVITLAAAAVSAVLAIIASCQNRFLNVCVRVVS